MYFKKTVLSLVFLFTGIFFNLGCDRSNPSKMGAPETYNTVSFQTKTSQINLHPKVDILFVIDNSQSMDVHQQKLIASVDSFVKSFSDNESLDFHIGVVSVFDSSRYGKTVKDFVPNGQLRPIPDTVEKEPAYFYTNNNKDSNLLKSLLKIGVIPFKDGGPEKEESFSPVIAALSEPQISSPANKGFYRADAHLVVIFITDASDASPNLSADQMYEFLLNLKQKDYTKIHTYGVLADRNDPECTKVDPSLVGENGEKELNSGKPDNIIDFIRMSHGSKLSICQANYGIMLSEMGKEIEVKVSKQVIYLDSIPELSTLCICKVGTDCKTLGADGKNKCIKSGWKYDPANLSIVFSDISSIKRSEGQSEVQLEVSFTPVKIQNVINGRAVRGMN